MITTELIALWKSPKNFSINDHVIMALVMRHCQQALMDDREMFAKYRRTAAVPMEYRGAVRRVDIVRESGLPFETARRHIDGLIERGLLKEYPGRLLRPRSDYLASPVVQDIVKKQHVLLMRYIAILKALGVDPTRIIP